MRRSSRYGVAPAVLAWLVGTSAAAQPGKPGDTAPIAEEGAAPAPEGPDGVESPPADPPADPSTEPAPEAPAGARGSGIIVPPPTIVGEAAEHIAGALQQAVRDGLGEGGIEVADAPAGCADVTCSAKAVSDGQARAYVSTEVRITGSDYALVADVLDGDGKSLVRKEGSCEICTYEEAAVALRELVAGASRELEPAEPQPVPAPVVTPEPESPRKRLTMTPQTTQILAFTAMGVGVAALAGGIALLVIDNNGVKSNCSGVHVDADGDCEFRYNTLGGGIGLTVAGAVVAGGGVGLFLWSRKQAKSAPAEVSLVPWGVRARF
jgi:hypothetical protein